MKNGKDYCVYLHTNLIDNKKYFGITSQNPIRRWNNGKGYQSNDYFYNSILKYGWDNFSHEILFTDLSKKEAEEIETELILNNRTNEYDFGYNQIYSYGEYINKFNISKALDGIDYDKDIKNNEFKELLFNALISRALTTSTIETTKYYVDDKLVKVDKKEINVPLDKTLINSLLSICEKSNYLKDIKQELEIKKNQAENDSW